MDHQNGLFFHDACVRQTNLKSDARNRKRTMETEDKAIRFPDRGERADVEEGTTFQPKFDEQGLIPCVTQDADSNEVLMVAFMNDQALARTIETGEAHYYSRSRKKLWRKGEQSGHTQKVVSLRTDCDQDTVLLKVKVDAAACHVGYRSCFYREVPRVGESPSTQLNFLEDEKSFDPAQTYGKG